MSDQNAYLLAHEVEFKDHTEDVRVIGIYSSREAAQRALDLAVTLPGFREHPTGFTIDEYHLDRISGWSQGYITETYWIPDAKGAE